jgi:hypothetical protein
MEEGEPRMPSIEAGEPEAEVNESEEEEATRELGDEIAMCRPCVFRGALGAFVTPPAAAPAEPFTPGGGVAAAVAAAVSSKIAMGSTPSVKDVSPSMGS